jgi:hypothetical protein
MLIQAEASMSEVVGMPDVHLLALHVGSVPTISPEVEHSKGGFVDPVSV